MQETLVKKGETTSNVLMIADERMRKTARGLQEATERQAKAGASWKRSKERKGKYDKEAATAAASFKKRRSEAGQASAKRLMKRAKRKARTWTITEGDDRYRAESAEDELAKLKDQLEQEKETVEDAKETKDQMDARIKHAQSDCTAANKLNDGSMNSAGKYSALKEKFTQMKIEYAAKNERSNKKAKAEGIWDKLQTATHQLSIEKPMNDKELRPDGEPRDKTVSMEDEDAILANKLKADKSSSATSLANSILNDKGSDDGVFRENGISLQRVGRADESHPLYRYALERKEKASELTDADGLHQAKKSELLQKSEKGMEHFESLKRAEQTKVKDEEGNEVHVEGLDTLEKWDTRVGADYHALGLAPGNKAEDPAADSEDVLLQEAEGKKVLDVDAAAEYLVEEMFRNEKLYMKLDRRAASLIKEEL